MVATFRVNVTRSDGSWLVDIPQLVGHRHPSGATNMSSRMYAHSLVEVDRAARSLVAGATGLGGNDVTFDFRWT